ncbi:MAG: hypothetical protein EBR82_09205 [Caulobacteraceae bacterium]|nr:hypothetical protein [Caulobacteraceae bacterium]
MMLSDPEALNVTLDSFVISAEIAEHVYGIVDDLKSAAIVQDAYQNALADMAGAPMPAAGGATRAFEALARTPHAFAQAWVRTLRDIAVELVVLANEQATAEAAGQAAALFGKAFPGVAVAIGPMRVTSVDPGQVYYAVGPGRFPVPIDDAAVRSLEAVVHTLLAGVPKEASRRAAS